MPEATSTSQPCAAIVSAIRMVAAQVPPTPSANASPRMLGAGGRPDTPRCLHWADCTIVDSPFGREQLAPGLPRSALARVADMPLPVRIADYRDAPTERGHLLLYSSMPDRGLACLARLFPAIRARVPTAELHVTGDFTLYGWAAGRADYERLFAAHSGVHYHGRVPRSALVELQKQAKILAFPCTFPEGFCIAAAEAMAAGAVPVTSRAFALTTTVGAAGVLIPGHPAPGRRNVVQRWLYGRRFVQAVVELLSDDEHWRQRSDACRQSAVDRFAPDAWYQRFTRLVIGAVPTMYQVVG